HGYSVTVSRLDGDTLHLMAFSTTSEAGDAALKSAYPLPLKRVPFVAKAGLDRVPDFVADTATDSRVDQFTRAVASARGFRSLLFAPIVLPGVSIGVIAVTRPQPGGFSDDEVALLSTFADQAVIAIENVRLFKELQTRNRDLTEALEQQT